MFLVSLVIKGGGAKSISYIGVLEAMEERKIVAKNIIGASAGSIFGFLIAVGVPVSMMKKVLFG